MPYEIETKDGIVIRGIPDNVQPDDPSIKAKVANARFQRDAQGSPEMTRKGGEMALADTSQIGRFRAGYAKSAVDLVRGAGQMVGLGNRVEEDERKARDSALMGSGAGFVGNLAGTVANTLPLIMAPGAASIPGAMAAGVATGGLQPVGIEDSRLGNMAISAVAGGVGQFGGNLVGRMIKPVQSTLTAPQRQLIAKAEALRIPLDAADRTGSRPLQVMRSVMESMPITAGPRATANQAKRAAFNRATLSTIGENADLATPEVLNAARTRIGNQFNDLAARNTVSLGDDFLNAVLKVEATGNQFTSPAVPAAVAKAIALIDDAEKAGGLSGRTYQNVRSTLGTQAKGAFTSGNAELGQALKTIQGALDDAATASVAPADKAAWGQARAQWQALKVMEKAAAPNSADAVAGNVSPAKLAGALLQSDRKGFTYGTRGDDLSDLARIGQAFVKENIPNSGTAERSFWTRVLEKPLNTLYQQGIGGISRPVQMAINSRSGQRYLTKGLADLSPQQLARIAALSRTGAIVPSMYATQ